MGKELEKISKELAEALWLTDEQIEKFRDKHTRFDGLKKTLNLYSLILDVYIAGAEAYQDYHIKSMEKK